MQPKLQKIANQMLTCKDMLITDEYFTQIGFENRNWNSDGDDDFLMITDDRVEIGMHEDRVKDSQLNGDTLIIIVERTV